MSASPYDVPYDAHVSPNPRQQTINGNTAAANSPSAAASSSLPLQRIASPSAVSRAGNAAGGAVHSPQPQGQHAQASYPPQGAVQAGYPAAVAQPPHPSIQEQAIPVYARPMPPPHQQQQPLPVQPQPQALPRLPMGAVPMNGGILFTSHNIFASSYRVPGPNGQGQHCSKHCWLHKRGSVPSLTHRSSTFVFPGFALRFRLHLL
jgi:hypothetical protein